jgi:hypothetical protein
LGLQLTVDRINCARHRFDAFLPPATTVPDVAQSKSAVLNSLTSLSSQRSYDHAIREFIEWYCSEPRLTFYKSVVTRYRMSLEQRHYAPSTVNLHLAAVRGLAHEAADCGLLSADLAAGIRHVIRCQATGYPCWKLAHRGAVKNAC